MKLLQRIYFPILCAALLLLAVLPLLQPGFFPVHDDQQIARLYELDFALKAGQFPVRWVSHLGFGYGYPLFIFYPPLVYYLGEIFHIGGFSLIDSTKLVIILGFVLSFVFMFAWINSRYGKKAGLFAGVMYTYAPYHALDIYVRGALAEFFSFVFIPAALWASDILSKKKSISFSIVLGFFLAFLVLTHNLTALPFIFFFGFYALHLLFTSKDKKKLLLLFGLSGLISLGLSAFFWLPSLLEKQFTLVDAILTKELADYKLHFVYIRQLWNSPWGYGGSLYGLEDGLSFQLGKLHIVVSMLSALLLVVLMFKKNVKEKFLSFPTVCLILLAFSVFMVTFHSVTIWNFVKVLSYTQFPWRFLLFSAVFTSAMGGFLIYALEKLLPLKINTAITGILIGIAIFLAFPYFRPSQYLKVSDSHYIENQDIEWRVSKSSFEYVPREVATKLSDANTTQLDIERNEIPKISFTVLSENVEVIEEKNTPAYKKYKTIGDGGKIIINSYYFPGWEVLVDGEKTSVTRWGKLKLISFDIPAGDHLVEVMFVNTKIRTISNALSLLTLLSALSYYVLLGLKKRQLI